MQATARHFNRRGLLISLYTPRLSRDRPRVELGFLVRARDPRAGRRRRQWRWLKVYVGWTNPELRDERGRILIAEVETHRTDRMLSRTTYKTYARVKLAHGAPRSS